MRSSLGITLCIFLVLGVVLPGATSCSGDGDKAAADTGPKPDYSPRPDEPFGSVCTNLGEKCKLTDKDGYDLHCIALSGSASGKGFCSRKCSDAGSECYNVPNGMMAGCFIDAGNGDDSGPGTKYCGFYCKSSKGVFSCPPKMQCEKENSQGTSVCKPLK